MSIINVFPLLRSPPRRLFCDAPGLRLSAISSPRYFSGWGRTHRWRVLHVPKKPLCFKMRSRERFHQARVTRCRLLFCKEAIRHCLILMRSNLVVENRFAGGYHKIVFMAGVAAKIPSLCAFSSLPVGPTNGGAENRNAADPNTNRWLQLGSAAGRLSHARLPLVLAHDPFTFSFQGRSMKTDATFQADKDVFPIRLRSGEAEVSAWRKHRPTREEGFWKLVS